MSENNARDPESSPSRIDQKVDIEETADQTAAGAESAGPLQQKALHIRCPHCHEPIELVEDNPLEEINCPSCGSSFGVIGDEGLAFETEGGTLHRVLSASMYEPF